MWYCQITAYGAFELLAGSLPRADGGKVSEEFGYFRKYDVSKIVSDELKKRTFNGRRNITA